MGIKAKLGMSVATGVLAFGLIGGGTYAYFSDSVSSTNTFASGKMDFNLKVNDSHDSKEVSLDLKNMVPGDSVTHKFTFNNKGSVDVSKLMLTSTNEGDVEFAKAIKVSLLGNGQNAHSTTLHDLSSQAGKGMDILSYLNTGAIKSGEQKDYTIVFEFVETGVKQDTLQAKDLKVTLGFEARTAGSKRDIN